MQAAPHVSPPNLLTNPGFEDGLVGWKTSYGTAVYSSDSSTSVSGCCSVKGVEIETASLGTLYQNVIGVAKPGNEYQISGWIRTSDVSAIPTGGGATIGLSYVGFDGATPADGGVQTIGFVLGTQGWTFYKSGNFTLSGMPSDAVALYFSLDFSAAEGTAWWDDVSLQCMSASGCPAANSTAVVCGGSTLLAANSSIMCTATVTGSSLTGAPMGDVLWSQTGAGTVAFDFNQCSISLSQCQVEVSGTGVGSVALNATYPGDRNYPKSVGTLALDVSPVTVNCSMSSLPVGTATKCVASVAGSSPSIPATGTVAWSSSAPGKFSRTTCVLANGTCSAGFTPSAVGPSVAIKATYGGDSLNSPSAGIYFLTVGLRTSKTAVSCKPTKAAEGPSGVIECTAKVKGYSPTGVVTWQQFGIGAVSLPAGTTCALRKGSCSVSFYGTSSGTVSVEATFGGDIDNTNSSGIHWNLMIE